MMNFKRSASSIIMNITPELAQEMLITSVGNRKLRSMHLKDLTNAILRGEWRITNQGIGFDVNGNLRDGHHRLNAIVKANTPVQMVVTFGMPVNAYEVIDCGATRSYSDRMDLSKSVAEPMRLAGFITFGCSRPTVDQLKIIGDTGLLEILTELVDFCGARTAIIASASFKLAASLIILNGGDKQYVFNQYRALCLANYEDQSQISLALEKKIKKGEINLLKTSNQSKIMAIGFRVLDINNANQKVFRINDDEIKSSQEQAKQIILRKMSYSDSAKQAIRSSINSKSWKNAYA